MLLQVALFSRAKGNFSHASVSYNINRHKEDDKFAQIPFTKMLTEKQAGKLHSVEKLDNFISYLGVSMQRIFWILLQVYAFTIGFGDAYNA